MKPEVFLKKPKDLTLLSTAFKRYPHRLITEQFQTFDGDNILIEIDHKTNKILEISIYPKDIHAYKHNIQNIKKSK